MATKDNQLKYGLLTAIAPIAWGSTYIVTSKFLPASDPLWGGALRGFPAGILLLLLARELPKGSWWWKSFVLGTLTVGAFFVLVYESAQLLPSSVAAPIMSLAPLVMMLCGWLLLNERPYFPALIGGGLGILGVIAIVAAPVGEISWWGVLCSLIAMAMSSFGYVLARHWGASDNILPVTAWQVFMGSSTVVIAAFIFEGMPPALDGEALIGFAHISFVATALGYVAWYTGLSRMSVAAVGLIGLLNPVTGVLLGTAFNDEHLTWVQGAGIALVLFAVMLGQIQPKRDEDDAAEVLAETHLAS